MNFRVLPHALKKSPGRVGMEGERGSVLLFGTSSFPPPEKVVRPNHIRTLKELKEARHPVIYARIDMLRMPEHLPGGRYGSHYREIWP